MKLQINKPKTIIKLVRFTPEQYQRVKKLAKQEGTKPTEMLRALLEWAISNYIA
jgi:predicted DNA-binding protein